MANVSAASDFNHWNTGLLAIISKYGFNAASLGYVTITTTANTPAAVSAAGTGAPANQNMTRVRDNVIAVSKIGPSRINPANLTTATVYNWIDNVTPNSVFFLTTKTRIEALIAKWNIPVCSCNTYCSDCGSDCYGDCDCSICCGPDSN